MRIDQSELGSIIVDRNRNHFSIHTIIQCGHFNADRKVSRHLMLQGKNHLHHVFIACDCRGIAALELMTSICKMFSDIVKLQKLYLSMLSCPDANGDWTGSFDVDVTLR